MAKANHIHNKVALSIRQEEFFVREYCAGILSQTVIAHELGVTRKTIRKWARDRGLKRHTKDEVRQILAEKKGQVAELVMTGVTKYDENGLRNQKRNQDRETAVIVEDVKAHTARVTAEVLREHTSLLSKLRILGERLTSELELITDHPEQFAEIAEIVANAKFQDDSDQRRVNEQIAVYERLLSLSNRVKDLLALANAIGRICDQERKNIGLDQPNRGEEDPEAAGFTPEKVLSVVHGHLNSLNIQINNYTTQEVKTNE